MERNSNSDEEQSATMKPVYSFEWYDSEEERESGAEPIRSRRTDELTNDSRDFQEAGVECLAQFGRDDPSCEVTLVGLTQIAG